MNLAKVSLKGKEYTAYELPILHAIDNINKTIFGGREHLERVLKAKTKKVKQDE